eukprot:CAMPEP_0204359180 /NCGR_PEP_ID=MMETSP0469-20131031/37064_1 /ASSEMBLY_ACC=CAM_ASM_000384 /TAXON_ID=2969 /ORGANISM="Oxyrrhis marina" /LENGTH=61 /DNA_ID=CAMNT_0051347165 /DNA_START=36 /DNA_END=217 /DNA_ORIENTATION=+
MALTLVDKLADPSDFVAKVRTPHVERLPLRVIPTDGGKIEGMVQPQELLNGTPRSQREITV